MRTPEQTARIEARDKLSEAKRRERVRQLIEAIPSVHRATETRTFDEQAARQASELARRTAGRKTA